MSKRENGNGEESGMARGDSDGEIRLEDFEGVDVEVIDLTGGQEGGPLLYPEWENTPPVEGIEDDMAEVRAEARRQNLEATKDRIAGTWWYAAFAVVFGTVRETLAGVVQRARKLPGIAQGWVYDHLGAFPYGDHLLDRKTKQEITSSVQLLGAAFLVALVAWTFFWKVNFQGRSWGPYLAAGLGLVFAWGILKLDAGIAFGEQLQGRKGTGWRQKAAPFFRLALIGVSAIVTALPIEVLSLDTEISAAMDRKSADLVAEARQKGYDKAEADLTAALERFNEGSTQKAQAIEQQVKEFEASRDKLRKEMIARHASDIAGKEAERQKVDADAVLEAGGQRIRGGRVGRGPKTETLERASERITSELAQVRVDQQGELKAFDQQTSDQIAAMRAGRVTPEQREAQATELRKARDVERARVAGLTVDELEAEFGGELSVSDGFSDRVAILHELMAESIAITIIAWLIRLAIVFFELLALIRVKFLVSDGFRAYFNPLVHASSSRGCPEWVITMCENRGLIRLSFERIHLYPEHVRAAMNQLDQARRAAATAILDFVRLLREQAKPPVPGTCCLTMDKIEPRASRHWSNSVEPMFVQLRQAEHDFQFGLGSDADPMPLPVWEEDRYGIEHPTRLEFEDFFNEETLEQLGWQDPANSPYYKAGVAAVRSYLSTIESWHQAMDEMARFVFSVVQEEEDLDVIDERIREKRAWILKREADLITRKGYLERQMRMANLEIPAWPEFSDPFEDIVEQLSKVNREHLDRLGAGWYHTLMNRIQEAMS
ncbi:DUF4407 domain-containing protein [Candidatus Nomurabacteria bacterium]|nr:DUF4407 domain-containing protein [Candidatus Nomurabacteria bacterium]